MELSTQNLYNNNQAIDRQKRINDLAIQENKLEAQDMFAQAFVGSGISGRTVDLTEASMKNDVAKAHNENFEQSQTTKDREFLGLTRQSQSNISGIKDLGIFDNDASAANAKMAGISAGSQSFISNYKFPK